MNILERRHTWLHTHFLTDCERLPPHRMQEIERQIIPVLRKLGIVYDIHFYAHRQDPGVRIVQPIPARPREMHIVTFERPAAGGGIEAMTPGSAAVPPEAGKEE
jgi:hypothetical protein